MLASGSGLERWMACDASTVLPRIESRSEYAAAGVARHSELEQLADGKEVATKFDTSELPFGTDFLLPEVAYSYSVERREARCLGRIEGREYGAGPFDIACKLDLSGVDETARVAYVLDYKTGRGKVTAAANNWQLRFGALCLARAHDVDSARVAIATFPNGINPQWDIAELDGFELDDVEGKLLDRAHRVLGGFDNPRPSMGEHCKYCPSWLYCPGQTALIMLLGTEPGREVHNIKEMLTPETAAEAYKRAKLVREATKKMEAALHAYAAEHPIQLADGSVLGPVETTREEVDGQVASDVLTEMFGSEVARKALELGTSKAAIERALKDAGPGQLAAAKRAVFGAIRERGGIRVKTTVSVKEHTP